MYILVINQRHVSANSWHKNALKTNSHTSNYAKHILEQSHTFGPIHQTMQILQFQDKGTHLNIIEWFFIYAEFLKNSHLNDEHCISPNKIFDALLKPQPTINPTPTPSNTQAPLWKDHSNLPDIITRQNPDTITSTKIQQRNIPKRCPTQGTG